jgi:phosphatidylglycerol:prolipoprotein diacylglycerol transferase
MRQILFEMGGIKIHGFGLMLALALWCSVGLAGWRAKREGLNPEHVDLLAIWVLVVGLLGARIFFVVEYWRSFHHWWEIFQIWKGGIVFYGSVLGGAVGFILFRRLHPFPLRPMLDVIAPALALGIALGRVGCFLNGCCYGDLCNLPWAMSFPRDSSPWADQLKEGLIHVGDPRSLPIHPTQLYSALDGLILMLLLSAYYPLRKRDGEVMALLMVTYPVTRFLIEGLRNDEAGIVFGMTISQAISVVVFLAGIVYWLYLLRLPTGRYADTKQPEPELAQALAS